MGLVIRSSLGGRAGSASEIGGLSKRVRKIPRNRKMIRRRAAPSHSTFKASRLTIRRMVPLSSWRSSSPTFSSASVLVKTLLYIRRRSHRCTLNFCSKNAVLKKSGLIARSWLRFLKECFRWSGLWRNPIMCSAGRVSNRSNSWMDISSYSNIPKTFSAHLPHRVLILWDSMKALISKISAKTVNI